MNEQSRQRQENTRHRRLTQYDPVLRVKIDFWNNFHSCYTSVFPCVEKCNSSSLDGHTFFETCETLHFNPRPWCQCPNLKKHCKFSTAY